MTCHISVRHLIKLLAYMTSPRRVGELIRSASESTMNKRKTEKRSLDMEVLIADCFVLVQLERRIMVGALDADIDMEGGESAMWK